MIGCTCIQVLYINIARIEVTNATGWDSANKMAIPEVVSLDVITDIETFSFHLRRKSKHNRNIPVFSGIRNSWKPYNYEFRKVNLNV